MQNSTATRLTTLTERVATVYQELFNELPVINGQAVYPQMPEFQLTYFIHQALSRHYFVQLQFKAAPEVAPMTVSGHLKQDAAGHLILRAPQLTTIVTPELLRSIQRVTV
ncbi:hypothetical protein ACS4N0_01505 [Levilactobacillus zymae]|uniref:hypothetical protein n=1 Tax=Levilactobacillus zymae TaxID=267363 RepID=UPI003FCDA25E